MLDPIELNMSTRTAAGILGMDTISLCSVIRDLHHSLDFRSDLSRKDQVNEPVSDEWQALGTHTFRTLFRHFASRKGMIDPAVYVTVCDHSRLFHVTQRNYDAPLEQRRYTFNQIR